MRSNMQHATVLQGVAWTGGILGVLLTVFLLVDIGLKLAGPALGVDVKARVGDHAEAVKSLEIALARSASTSVPRAAVLRTVRYTVNARAVAERFLHAGHVGHEVLAAAVAGTLAFGGSLCMVAGDEW